MTGAAQLVKYSLAFVPVIATTWPQPLGKMDDLRYLRHTFVNARQRICFVVDDNEDLQFVQAQHVIGKGPTPCASAGFTKELSVSIL
jgi:hypothetical protein